VLSAIAVPCWLILRLYRRRTPANRLPVAREILLLGVVVCVAGIAAATLTPNRGPSGGLRLRPTLAALTCSSASLPPGSTAHSFCVHNARGNIILFFPLGILIALGWRHLRVWKGILVATALSFSIEAIQYFSSAWGGRTADVND